MLYSKRFTKTGLLLAAIIVVVMGYPDYYYDDSYEAQMLDAADSVDTATVDDSLEPDFYEEEIAVATVEDPPLIHEEPALDSGASDPYEDPYPLPDPTVESEYLSEFELCVLEQLAPQLSCADFDSDELSCVPVQTLSDDAVLAACAGAHSDFLATDDEKRAKIQEFRQLLNNAAGVKAGATNLAATLIPGGYADGPQDALRHMIGAAMLYRATPEFFRRGVLAILNGREDLTQCSGMMDTHNNRLGIQLVQLASEEADFLCYFVPEALRKIKDGTAKLCDVQSANAQEQMQQVEYWLANLDELRQLLGCPAEAAADMTVAP